MLFRKILHIQLGKKWQPYLIQDQGRYQREENEKLGYDVCGETVNFFCKGALFRGKGGPPVLE